MAGTGSIDNRENHKLVSLEEKECQNDTGIQDYSTFGSCPTLPIDTDDDDDDHDEEAIRLTLSLSTPGREAVGRTRGDLARFLNDDYHIQPAANRLQGHPITNIDDLRRVLRARFPLGLPAVLSDVADPVPISMVGARLVRLSVHCHQLDRPHVPITHHEGTPVHTLGQQHRRHTNIPLPHTPPPIQPAAPVTPAPRPAPSAVPTPPPMTINAGCIICFKAISDTVLFPCRHLVMCEVCSPSPIRPISC
ncbi:hypothetical protein Q9L58_005870 [Maublancomyces gigas]|uniref:RING-type domain-containing protein n=1 Tax=Discina gigas TaxID=1032678 RepID=A0ABR3GH02_9PEZI